MCLILCKFVIIMNILGGDTRGVADDRLCR